MRQLIYRSEPFGFDRATLAGILMDARLHNRRDDITGALICRHDLYLQLIEGPAVAIDAAFARIAVDHRHCEVRLLLDETIGARLFPQWAMLHDETPSLTWSPDEIADGAIDSASPSALRDVFIRMAASAIPAARGSRGGAA